MEAIKIIIDHPCVLFNNLLIYDGGDCDFKKIKLSNGKRKGCICTKTPEEISIDMDYEQFCGSKANDKVKKGTDKICVMKVTFCSFLYFYKITSIFLFRIVKL